MSNLTELQSTMVQLSARGKGLLAADESIPTITKRLQAIAIESTEETRRAYRDLLFTTPKLSDYISGIILFEETLNQKTDGGILFPQFLQDNQIIPGIKVDKGLVPVSQKNVEQLTQGLDGLSDRLQHYKKQGAQFAKWRAVYSVGDQLPSEMVCTINATGLARYAQICQDNGIVPIVEPEVLIDGDHTIAQCERSSKLAFESVFEMLNRYDVILECMILKPSMVIAGKKCSQKSSVEQVAKATVRILKETVPAAVQTINFLSGGQTPVQATQHLNQMNQDADLPWNLSFSYARALQEPCMSAWAGKIENKKIAQTVLHDRARLNHFASIGQYNENMEKELVVV